MAIKPDFIRRLREVSDRDARSLHEHFIEPAECFDPASMEDHLFFPLEMTWFYGEPVYWALPPEKQVMLNRLSFCQSYLSTAVAEAATNVLNYEAALDAFTADDTDAGIYMAREVFEETIHLHSFLIVIRKLLGHYGLSLEQLRATNVSLPLARRYAQVHSLIGWMRGDFDYYYFTRFALNVNQKTVERCTINEPRMHPKVREILRNHAIDEARHMQMSRATGAVALARMGPLQRNLACIGYAHFAARIYIGRHRKDGSLQAATRTKTLELCGVPPEEARRAYVAWRDRTNQPEDPPLVRAGRVYYLKQNHAYIDELPVSARMQQYMKRTIEHTYSDVAGDGSTAALEFNELTRTS